MLVLALLKLIQEELYIIFMLRNQIQRHMFMSFQESFWKFPNSVYIHHKRKLCLRRWYLEEIVSTIELHKSWRISKTSLEKDNLIIYVNIIYLRFIRERILNKRCWDYRKGYIFLYKSEVKWEQRLSHRHWKENYAIDFPLQNLCHCPATM